jgi:hypothetical protein
MAHDLDLREVAPPPRRGEWAQSPTLPLPPPRDRRELDSFLEALSTVEIQDVEKIRTMFASFDYRETLAAVFHEALSERPCGDISRFMLLLSAVGELAASSSLEPLYNLTWAEDADLLAADPTEDEVGSESSYSMFPGSGMIQSRAIEMFAWIATGREEDRLLRVVADHPSVATRLAAADAYLFAYDDAADARQRLLAVARPEDHNGIGVPRLVRGGDREAFDRALENAQGRCEVSPPRRIDIRVRQRERDTKGESNVY